MDSRRQKGWVNTSNCKNGSWIPDLSSPEFSHCVCSHCTAVATDTLHWTCVCKPAIKSCVCLGNRVWVSGRESGVVKYIGDLDSQYTNDTVYIGIKLDDPVGEHDGLFNGKRFFSCPDHHGIIVPEKEVYLQPKSDQKASMNTLGSVPVYDRCSVPGRGNRSGRLSVASKSWAQKRISENMKTSFVMSPCVARDSVGVARDSVGDTSSSNLTATAQSLNAESAVEGGSGHQSVCDTDFKSRVTEVDTVCGNHGDMRVEDAEEEKRDERQSHTRVAREEIKGVTQSSVGEESKTRAPTAESGVAAIPPTVAGSHTSRVVKEAESSHSRTEQSRRYLSSQFSGLSGTVPSAASSSHTSSQRYTHCPTSYESPSEKVRGHSDKGSVCFSAVSLVPLSAESALTGSSRDQVAINRQPSLTSCLMSRLPPASDHLDTVESAEEVVQDMTSFNEVVSGWGGDVGAWTKAGTYQKLKNALRRGVQEMQWQRNIRELETNHRYSSLGRQFRELRANIGLNRRATAIVGTEITGLRKKMRQNTATVTFTKAKLDAVQERVVRVHTKIRSYPSKNKKIGKLQIMAQGAAQGQDIFAY